MTGTKVQQCGAERGLDTGDTLGDSGGLDTYAGRERKRRVEERGFQRLRFQQLEE